MEYRCGLWKKKSEKGTTYCSGKIKIGTTEYQVRLFNNDKKGNDKAPDFNLLLKVNEINEEPKQEQVDPFSDDNFKAFGDSIEKDEIPF